MKIEYSYDNNWVWICERMNLVLFDLVLQSNAFISAKETGTTVILVVNTWQIHCRLAFIFISRINIVLNSCIPFRSNLAIIFFLPQQTIGNNLNLLIKFRAIVRGKCRSIQFQKICEVFVPVWCAHWSRYLLKHHTCVCDEYDFYFTISIIRYVFSPFYFQKPKTFQSFDQFEMDGCDNCEEFLRMKNNKDNVYDCTSNNFDGLIAVMSPEDSWVCKWQRISENLFYFTIFFSSNSS